MKIAITSPIFVKNDNHVKYLNLTTKSIRTKHDYEFIAVENYLDPSLVPIMYQFDQKPKQIHKVTPPGRQSVSNAWNIGIDKAQEIGADYILVINHDIIFKSNAIDRLVAFAESHQEPLLQLTYPDEGRPVMWTMSEYADQNIEEAYEDEGFNEHPHFSCFMVKPDFFKYVGRFDENFYPAYLEDGDMHARLALANLKAYTYGGARFFHFGSRTIKEDRELWDKNTRTFPQNQQYFVQKWGHPIVNEVDQMRQIYYKHPYNEEDKPLSYWEEV